MNLVNKILNEIRTFMGGMNGDSTFSTVPKNQYVEAESIKLTQPTPQSQGAVTVSLGNVMAIQYPNINFASDDDDYKAWRIAFDISAPNLPHVFLFRDASGTLIHIFSIQTAQATPATRYADLKAKFNVQIALLGTGGIYIDAPVISVATIVHVGFRFYGNSDYNVSELINVTNNPGVQIIKEYFGTACNGAFTELKSYDYGGLLFSLITNGNVLAWCVDARDDNTGDWYNWNTTKFPTILFQTKQIKIPISYLNIIDLDMCINFNDKISAYFTATGVLPRVIYTHDQADFSAATATMSAFIWNEIPAYIETGNPDGYYTFEGVEAQTKLQILQNFAVVNFVSMQDGGRLTAGDKMYMVRQSIGLTAASGFNIVSNPINVMVLPLTNNAIHGDAGGTPTSKSITLEITGLDPALYDHFDLAVVENIDGAMVASIVNTYTITGTNQTVTHTGNERSTDLALADIVTQQIMIRDAANLVLNRNRLFLLNVNTRNDLDLSAFFASNAVSVTTGQSTIPAIGKVLTNIAEYQLPANVNQKTGYMLHETYRLGALVFENSGYVNSVYFIKDWTCFYNAGGNNLLTDANGSGVPQNIFVYYPQVTIDYTTAPDIDGTPFLDAIYGISIVRQECIPEVFSGYIFPQTQQINAAGILHFRYGGSDASGGVISNLVYTAGPTNAFRQFLSFISPDLLFNQQTLNVFNSDYLINSGQPALYNTVTENRVDGIHVDYCYFYEFNGQCDTNSNILNLNGTNDKVSFNSVGTQFINGTKLLDTTLDGSTTYIEGATTAAIAIGLSNPNFANPITANTDYAIYHAYYVQPKTNKYGDTNQGNYISCGHLETSPATALTMNVYGGDTFTQKTIIKLCTFSKYLVNDYRRVGISVYTQNRFNEQMRNFTNVALNNLDYPYTTVSLEQWLSGDTTGSAELNTGQLNYSVSYTPINNFQTYAVFNPELFIGETIHMPTTAYYSNETLNGGTQDALRIILPLNVKNFPQIYRAIHNTFADDNYLFILTETAAIYQGISLQALSTTAAQQVFILGDSTVLGSQEQIITNYGSQFKTSAIKYLSATGKWYISWFDTLHKKWFRRGPDGIRDLGKENLYQSFLYANNNNITENSNICLGYDMYSDELLICINSTVAQATLYDNASSYTAGDIVYMLSVDEGAIFYYQAQINIDADDPDLPNSDAGLFQKWDIYRQSNYLLAFNEKLNCFCTFYPYSTKIFIPYKNTFLSFYLTPTSIPYPVSFLYEHNRGDILQWYTEGVVRNAYLKTVLNNIPEVFKTLIRLWIRCKNIPSYLHIKGNNRTKTFAEPEDFQQKREFWWVNSKNDATVTVNNPSGTNTLFTQRTSGETITVKVFFDTENKMSEISAHMFEKPRIPNQ